MDVIKLTLHNSLKLPEMDSIENLRKSLKLTENGTTEKRVSSCNLPERTQLPPTLKYRKSEARPKTISNNRIIVPNFPWMFRVRVDGNVSWSPSSTSESEPFSNLDISVSSSTPNGGPYSSTDIVSYSNDVGNRHITSEEFRHNNLVENDRDRRKSNGVERRPSSLNTSPKSLKTDTKVTNIERPGRERESEWENLRHSQQFERDVREKERTLNVDRIPLPDEREEKINNKPGYSGRTNCFKPLGSRNNIITNRDPQIISSHQSNHSQVKSQSGPSREPEDLVAMGTIWNPNNNVQSTKPSNNNTKAFTVSNPTATQINVSSSLNPALTMSKKYPTSRISQLTQNSGNKKEVEPRYTDPIIGSPGSFQQRLAELATLESETVRWERNRKFKKKKQQQDTS